MFQTIRVILCAALALSAASCGSVYQSSLSGSLLDQTKYIANPQANNNGIQNVTVYLYLDQTSWDNDRNAWSNGSGQQPEYNTNGSGKLNYYASTVSDNTGAWSFNGILWSQLFAEFGKTADRRQVYLLFWHPDYGLLPSTYPIYVVSDVGNTMPPILLQMAYNLRTINSRLYDSSQYGYDTNTGVAYDTNVKNNAGLGGITVDVFIPDDWTYSAGDTDGTQFSGFKFPKTPSVSVQTANDGRWSANLAFRMKPTRASNKKTVRCAVRYNTANYLPFTPYDVEWRNDIDLNGDGRIDTADIYYLTPVITAQATNTDPAQVLPDRSLTPSANAFTLRGYVYDNTAYGHDASGNAVDQKQKDNAALGGINVDVYVPESWEYVAGDTTGTNITNVKFPANPTYTVQSDNTGRFEQNVQFPMRPGWSTNNRSVILALRYRSANWLFHRDIVTNIRLDLDLNRDGVTDVTNDQYILTAPIRTTQNLIWRTPDVDLIPANNAFVFKGYVYDHDAYARDSNGNAVDQKQKDNAGINAVNVDIYVPDSWEYVAGDTTGANITNAKFPPNPTYTVQSDNTGLFQQTVNYPMVPERGTNFRSLVLGLRYRSNNRLFHPQIQTNIRTDFDLNRDGILDTNDFCIQIQPIRTTQNMVIRTGDVDLVSANNSATLKGKVVDLNNTNNGIQNVQVSVYMPDAWAWDANTNLGWQYDAQNRLVTPLLPANATAQANTAADGSYSFNLTWPKLVATNAAGQWQLDTRLKLSPAVLTYAVNDFRIDSTVDTNLCATNEVYDAVSRNIDFDQDGRADVYRLVPVLTDRKTLDLLSMSIKKIRFTTGILGRIGTNLNTNGVFDSSEGVNGVTVRLFLNRTNAPATNESPDYVTTTKTMDRGNNTVEDGHFSFTNVTWSDLAYTNRQSLLPCYVQLVRNNTMFVTNQPLQVYSDADNYFDLLY